MHRLDIQFKKKADGSSVLHCQRPDGTATWERRAGTFFVLHDLGHYAAETTLGLADGFFGLLAQGWNITDFGTPWPRGPVPPGADLAEHVVGLLDQESALPAPFDAGAFNDALTAAFADAGKTPGRRLTDDELARIRTLRRDLAGRWFGLPPGEALSLVFP